MNHRVIKNTCLLFLLFFLKSISFSQKIQTIGYDGIFRNADTLVKKSNIGLLVSILKGQPAGPVMYSERQKIKTDSSGMYHLDIGSGTAVAGKFDSIIWSDGAYYLQTVFDTINGKACMANQNVLMRIEPDLNNDHEIGTITSSDHPTFGEWHFKNTRNKRPKIVNIDLTTSYANLAYPANTYPVYRHYEWCDPDMDGTGNSFTISYSENTNNDFRINTKQLGDVRLYSKPFQELFISSTNNEIIVTITEPVPLTSHSETYAIKGPWKFIYYIEW